MRRASYGARDGSWGRRGRPSALIGRYARPRLPWRFSRAWVREGGGGWGRFSGGGGRIWLIPFDPESPLTLSGRWYRRSAVDLASARARLDRLIGSIARPASTAAARRRRLKRWRARQRALRGQGSTVPASPCTGRPIEPRMAHGAAGGGRERRSEVGRSERCSHDRIPTSVIMGAHLWYVHVQEGLE